MPSLSFACLHVFPVAYSDGGGVDGGSVTPDVRQACTMLGAAWFIAARPHIAKKFEARKFACYRCYMWKGYPTAHSTRVRHMRHARLEAGRLQRMRHARARLEIVVVCIRFEGGANVPAA